MPRLVYPLMEQERQRRNLNTSDPPTTTQCSCLQRDAKVLVVSFTSMLPSVVCCSNNINTALVLAITPIMIQYCECTHPAIALIRQGAFTSTPVNPPKWAFDLQYLAFVSEQFLAGIPNYSAWCNGAIAFLTKDGCQQVPTAVSKAKFQASICITHSLSSQLLLDLYPQVYSIISWSWTRSAPSSSELY